MTTPAVLMHLGDLEGANKRAFHTRWLSGGMTPAELMEHFMSHPIVLHPITCLVQSSGTGKSRLIYETALRSPSLYAALASSRYGTYPPPAKFASCILSLRNSKELICLLTQWTNLMLMTATSTTGPHQLSSYHGRQWFEYQLTSITADSFNKTAARSNAEEVVDHTTNGHTYGGKEAPPSDPLADPPAAATVEVKHSRGSQSSDHETQNSLAPLWRQLETNVLRVTVDAGHQRLFLFLDEAQCIFDDPQLRLYNILRKGLLEFNRSAQCGCSIHCVLVSDTLPPSMIFRRQLRTDFPYIEEDTDQFHAAVVPVYALGVQGEPQVVHPSLDTAHFCSTTASMRRFGRPAWRIGIDDDTIFTLYTQRMALIRQKMNNSALFHRILVCLTAYVAYRNHDEISDQLMRHGWGQLMESGRHDTVVAYSSEPFLASVAINFLRHNTEVAAIMDVLAVDARRHLWDVEQRHPLIARLSVLRALSHARGKLTPFSDLARALWGQSGSLEQVLPPSVLDYNINLNHFIKPDIAHLMKISLSSFFQRCAGLMVSSQYHHFDFAIPVWTGRNDEALEEARMSAVFVSVMSGVRGQRPGAQFWSFFKALSDNRLRATKTPVLELARRVAKPAIFLILERGCQETKVLDTGANLYPARPLQRKVTWTSSQHSHSRSHSRSQSQSQLSQSCPHPPLPQRSDSSLHRRQSPAALSDADTRCTSEARTSFDHGHFDFDSSDLDMSRKPSQPSTADWIVIHAPLYPGVYKSPLWLRAAALAMDPSVSTAVVPQTNCVRATSLFYHQAMSTTPTSLLVDE